MNLWRCFGGGDQQISLVAFAETVSDMKNQTSDSYSARKSTPDRACETFIVIVWVIVIFGGETTVQPPIVDPPRKGRSIVTSQPISLPNRPV